MKIIVGIIMLLASCYFVVNDKQSAIKISVVAETTATEDMEVAADIYDMLVSSVKDDIYSYNSIDEIKQYLIDSKKNYITNINSKYSNATISLYCNNKLYNEYTYIDKKCDLNKILIEIGNATGNTISSNIKVSEVIKSSDEAIIIKPILSR